MKDVVYIVNGVVKETIAWQKPIALAKHILKTCKESGCYNNGTLSLR